MTQYFMKRSVIYLLVLFGITLISFSVIHLAPGSPLDYLIDPNMPAETIEAKKIALGLNAPLPVQYIKWLGNILQGDLGYSVTKYGQPVAKMIGERIGPTLLLTGISLLIGILISIPLGIISAVKQNSALDYATTSVALISISVPNFFLAMGLIYFFCLKMKWFPSNGMYSLSNDKNFWDLFRHMIIPVTVLAVNVAGSLVRYVRSAMIEVLSQDYLRTAYAKGLKEFWVVCKHGLRNALNPIVTIIGIQVSGLIGGSVVIEQIFSWPGLGLLTYEAIQGRDYATVMAINLITGIIVLVVNFLTDLVYVLIDPRIKLN